MPPKIKLVAKSDAEIALEKKYELLRKQRAGVAAGLTPPGAKRVADPGRTAAVASSSAAGAGPSKDAPGGVDQKPMTAFERAKLMLARDAEKKRVEAEKRKAKQASSQPSLDDPFAARGRREEASTLPKKKTPPLKRPAPRSSTAPAHKKLRDDTFPYASGEMGAHETSAGYESTHLKAPSTTPPLSVDPSKPRVVFVSDLPEACAPESLASALYRFGNVDDARVVEGRLFGFVTFAEPEGAAKAVRASQAAAAGEGASVVIANHAVTISFARGKSGAGDPEANAALYAQEIKNKAASMATGETSAHRVLEPEKHREMVTYDDI